MFIYLFLRERQRDWKAGREGDKRIPRRLRAVSTEPDAGLQLANHKIMTWAGIKSWVLGQLSHPGNPTHILILIKRNTEPICYCLYFHGLMTDFFLLYWLLFLVCVGFCPLHNFPLEYMINILLSICFFYICYLLLLVHYANKK